MWDRIERVNQPTSEALTLEEVKQQCRVDAVDDDAFLGRCIKAAREMVEGPDGAGIALMAASWEMKMDCFPAEVHIPMGPVLSVDSIEYADGAGMNQTLDSADFQWRKGKFEARIKPAHGKSWPSTRGQFDAVTVTFKAGYPGTNADTVDRKMIPESLRVAMMMLIAHWNENRETSVVGKMPADVAFGFESIMNQFRVGRIA
jgi:uncharacterized phiE125 gp8 family phage protein